MKYIFLALVSCLLMVAAQDVSAQPDYSPSAPPFSTLSKPPFKISIYQEPNGFRDQLLELDTREHLSAGRAWHPFRSADIWIFFLKDEKEVRDLGGGVDDLYYSVFQTDEAADFFRRIDFETDNGRKITLFFFFVGNQFTEQFLCKSSITANYEISRSGGLFPLEQLLKHC